MIIELTKGKQAIIDDCDAHLVSGRKWQAHQRRDGMGWYAVSGGGIRMHRLLLGVTDKAVIVDHVDGDGLNNRRLNIRSGTQSLNCVNRKTTPGKYLRGARPKKGRWQSYIKLNGVQRSLGYFATEQEAHRAYMTEARRIHGDWMPLPSAPALTKSANP